MAYTRLGNYASGQKIGTGSGQQNLNTEFDAVSTETQAIRSITLTTGTGLTGGGSLAANRSFSISAGGVGTTQLADGGVTEAKLGAGAVATAKIADGAVATAKIADGAVTPAKMNLTTLSAFQATRSTNATWAAGSEQVVGFATEVYDRLNEYSTTNSMFTAAANGLYLFTVSLVVTPSTDGVVSLFLVGDSVELAPLTCQYLPAGAARYLCGSGILKLSATDTVRVLYRTGPEMTVNSNALSLFSGIKLA